MAKKSVRDVEVSGKRVLVRADLNAPQREDGTVSDDTRLRASRPTLQYLRTHGARIVLMSHLGRPKGKVDERFRMAPIAARLSEILRPGRDHRVRLRRTGGRGPRCEA